MAQAPKQGQVSDSAKKLIGKLKLKTPDDEPLKIVSIRVLEPDRRKRYGTVVPDLANAKHDAYACDVCMEDGDEKDVAEKIVVINRDTQKAKDIICECKIVLDEVPPSGFVEYQFDEDGPWYVSEMCQSAMESYRGSKFQLWKQMMYKPDCEAAFRRLLQIGLITKLFDNVAFPMPEEEKADWQVKDEHGKTVQIPRPINALRIWNAKKRGYDMLSSRLGGAPAPQDEGKFWQALLQELKDMHSAEYVESLMEEK